jgi:hypothetical protein
MAEPALERACRGADLRAPRGRPKIHQRKEAVRRAAGDETHDPRFLERCERTDDIAPVRLLIAPPCFAEALQVIAREPLQRGLARVAADVARRQVLEAREPVLETRPDQIVVQHRDQSRRERQCDPSARAAIGTPLEHPEERQIALDQRLDEPALLERILVLGMAHVRKVRVQQDREVAGRHQDSPGRAAR